MVEISLSGSGEGLGWATGRGYSTTYFSLVNRQNIGEDYTGDGALGEWVIIVNRKDGIPDKLQRRKDAEAESEVIDGETYYYLDPELLKNIGLLLHYQADIDWAPGS